MFKLVWHDASLQWDPDVYDGIRNIEVEQQKVWLPDIVITNTMNKRGILGFDEMKLLVEHTGMVAWQPSGLFTLSCQIDVTYFPFDQQICKIVVSTYSSTEKDISFVANSFPKATNTPNGLWEIVNVTTELLESGDTNALPEIFVYLDLKRRPVYYIVNVLLPAILLSIVSVLVFLLPVDSGEKIGLCITVLLAFFVFLSGTGVKLPVTSLQTPFLVIFISSLTGMSGLSLLASIAVLNVHHRPDHIPIPGFIKVWVRCMLCKRLKMSVNKVSPIEQQCLHNRPLTLCDSPGCGNGEEKRNENLTPEAPVTEDLDSEVRNDLSSEVRITWQQVARCVDITCFVFFSAGVMITNILFGLIMLQTIEVKVQGY
ncbi:acetylcholine receptor subunit beta-like [Haliotis rubra]|uniref:acetylcholine receptor subunit beta-like n=1 Tax=Haliotis rubra TaxID=36100 RepID=UPI001EE5D971|nr:acetylcholine receptor subunit beta-like [Haliotis rubra]